RVTTVATSKARPWSSTSSAGRARGLPSKAAGCGPETSVCSSAAGNGRKRGPGVWFMAVLSVIGGEGRTVEPLAVPELLPGRDISEGSRGVPWIAPFERGGPLSFYDAGRAIRRPQEHPPHDLDPHRRGRPPLPRPRHRAGHEELGGGRGADRCRARPRREGARRRPQPARAEGLGDPARRDRHDREGRAPARERVPRVRAVHDPLAVHHVLRHRPAVRDPADRGGREPQLRDGRGPPARARRQRRRARRPGVHRPDGADDRRAPRDLERGHRRGGFGAGRARRGPGPVTAAELREDGTERPVDTVDPDYPVTPVPRSARRGVVSISVVLIGFTVCAPTLMAGASIGVGFPFAEFLAVLAVGSGVLGAYVAAIGFLGARTGLTTVVMSRYTFGTAGSKVVSLLLGGTQVGWYGVAVGSIGQMTALAFGWESTWAPALVMIGVSALMMLTALYGYEGMYWVSLISTPLI